MSPETLTALQESIAHWEKNALAERPYGADIDGDSCALCAMFHTTFPGCGKCPVADATGLPNCANSPWLAASDTLIDWRRGVHLSARRDAFRAAARAEVEFLKSLLPLLPESQS